MGNILSNWAGRLITNWYRGVRQVGGVWFYPVGGVARNGKIDYLESFESVPELNAIINTKANAFSNGKIKAYIKTKDGLKDVSETDPVVALLKKPNFFQSEKEFLKQTKCFHEIFGNEYLYINAGTGTRKLSNFAKNVKAISTLPPNLVTCEYEQSIPFFEQPRDQQPEGIRYTYSVGNNKEIPLFNDFLIHLNDNRVNIKDSTSKDFLKGESKMKALTPAINNIIMAYETRGVILANRGALGIISNEGADVAGQIPMTPSEREELQKQYTDNYGGLAGQKSMIITNARVKYQQITVNPDKLGLFDECKDDFFKMCDSYGVPQELFASSKGTTFENQKAAETRLYSGTTIPEANEWIGAIQGYFYPNNEVILCMDYSHLSVFQEDLQKKAVSLQSIVSTLSTALADKVITIEEYQTELNKYGISAGNSKQQ